MKITRIFAALMATAMASLALVGCYARTDGVSRYYSAPAPRVTTAPGTPAPPRVSTPPRAVTPRVTVPRTAPRMSTPHTTAPHTSPYVSAPHATAPRNIPNVSAPRTTTPNTNPYVSAPRSTAPRSTAPNTASPRAGISHNNPRTNHHAAPHANNPRMAAPNTHDNRHALNRMDDGHVTGYAHSIPAVPRLTGPRTLVPATPATPVAPSVTHPRTATDARRSVAVMNTDFSEIGVLDATKRGWGHGGPTDSSGRSDGAVLYQEKYGHLNAIFIGPNENRVFLTFDEGYEKGFTPSILDTLGSRGVSAVFFITLPYAQKNPELVRRMIDEGHIIGNHSARHPSFPDIPLHDAARDIMQLHDYIKTNFGYEMTLFRPPMGEFSEQTLALAQKLGYTSVFWSWTHKDWLIDDQPPAAESLNKLLREAHPGAVYLLHAVSQTNAEILGDAIDRLREMGYEIARWDIS